MGYTTPSTWTAGAVLTAAQLNQQLRDNLLAAFPLAVDGWTTYTPTLTQSGAVTKTGTYAKYFKIGRLVVVQLQLLVSGTGTGANAVLVGLPPLAAAAAAGTEVGTGTVFDSSANLAYKGNAILASSTTVQFRAGTTSTGVLGSTDFVAGLAVNDTVALTAMYESTT